MQQLRQQKHPKQQVQRQQEAKQRQLQETTGIQTTAVDDPISAVAIGTGRYTEFIEGKQTKA